MDQIQFETLLRLFDEARDLPPDQWPAFIEQHCGGDGELRHKLESMLEHRKQVPEFLEQPIPIDLEVLFGLESEDVANKTEPLLGKTIGHYEIKSLLGVGGMGQVFLAQDTTLPRQVAIKFLPQYFTSDPERVRRFEQEAHAVSALNHPNIVTIHESGQYEGSPYIVMEYVHGETLRERMKQARLEIIEVIHIATQVANGLEEAHGANIIHRDIKPENIMTRGKDGIVKVLDFGIAKISNEQMGVEGTPSADLFNTAGVIGTVSYMSPEQARGETLDKRTDIFSLGLVLFEMVTGKGLFADKPKDEILQILCANQEPFSSNYRLDYKTDALERVIRKALKRNRNERYGSAKEIMDDLKRLRPDDLKIQQSRTAVEDEVEDETKSLALLLVEDMAWQDVEYETESLLGKTIGHYQIISLLGEGGMGKVFLAQDTKLGRQVAIKLLPLHFTADPERVRRFEQEARAASSLNHPNILTIHEIGQHGRLQYIVMEHVVGQTLRECLQGERLTGNEAEDIAAQIADALAAAHHVGIIHRNIKPENIMLRRENGRVKILDFGIAALATAPGAVIETASYMSPEQACGENLDGRTDMFSLGLILFEMVTGKGLFAGMREEKILQLLQSKQELLAADYKFDGAPKALEQIIRKTLKRTLAERYETAQQMLVDLKKLQRRTATKWLRWSVISSLFGMVLLLVALGFAAWFSTTEIWEETVLRDGHAMAVRRAVFSPDGRLLVSVSDDKLVIVWDFVHRKRLKMLTAHTERVNSIAFSSDGKWFATGSHDKKVIVWDAVTLEKIRTLREHQDAVNAVAFSPDGKWLASASSGDIAAGSDFRTIMWDTSRWQKAREIPHGVVYGPILFSPDSRWLVTNQVQWDWVSGKQVVNDELPLEKKWGGWNWAAFSPDAKLLVSTGGAGEVIFRELARRGDLTASKLMQKTRAHQDFGRAVAFSPDGKLVATGTDVILLWDMATKKIVSRFDEISSVWSLVFSSDGRWLVSAHGDGSIQVRDMNNRRRTVGFDGHGDHYLVVVSSPDGKRIASAGKDGAVILWNAETEQKETVLFGHETQVINLAFFPDGSWLASLDQDGYLIRWDLENNDWRWKVKAHSGSGCLAISPDGKWLTNTWAIYETSEGRELIRWDQMQAGIMMADASAFSPDGKHVAVVGGRKLILFDTQIWRAIAQQEVNSNLTRISFSPDGRNVVTGSEDGRLIWWDATTLQKSTEVKEHSAAISAAVFSPDGKMLASADKDQIIIWDANSRERMTTIENHAIPIYSLAFSPDGKRLIAAKRDRTVRVFTHHQTRWGQQLD